MPGWSAVETRWAVRLMGAVLPGTPPERSESALATFRRATDPFAEVGLRAAVWVLWLLPLFSTGRTFGSLAPARADALLQRWYTSDRYLLRQMVTVVKMVACLARYGR